VIGDADLTSVMCVKWKTSFATRKIGRRRYRLVARQP